MALPTLLLALPVSAGIVSAAAVLAGAGVMVFNTLWETALQRHVPERALSRVSAYDWLGSLALQPIGFALIGPLGAQWGIGLTLALAGVGQVLCITAILTVRDVRGLRQARAGGLQGV
jgi:hypothetical protein